jgi:hypothetical protein
VRAYSAALVSVLGDGLAGVSVLGELLDGVDVEELPLADDLFLLSVA